MRLRHVAGQQHAGRPEAGPPEVPGVSTGIGECGSGASVFFVRGRSRICGGGAGSRGHCEEEEEVTVQAGNETAGFDAGAAGPSHPHRVGGKTGEGLRPW